ncbi:MAG: DUF6688 family protein, partial [Planctomycetota bacterium]
HVRASIPTEGFMSNLPPVPENKLDPPSAPVPGVELDAEGRLASDVLCWSCNYNLRTLPPEAGCPECGMPIATTLEHRDGRKARPFSLHTINPVSRTIGFLFGMVGPALMVVLAGSSPMRPLNVEWQSGELRDYIGVMLAGRAMWAFYPFLIWAYVAFAAVMIAPVIVARQWWARAGLWLGCALGLQYQLIVGLHLMGFSEEFFIALFIGLIPFGLLAVIVLSNRAQDRIRKPKQRKRRSPAVTTAFVVGTLILIGVVGVVTRGLILLLPLFAGPYLMLLCMSATLCRVYRTDFKEPPQRGGPIPVTLSVGGYAAAWPVAISQAQIVYSSLPTTPPACYVCTASAHGHRWLTRAEPVQFTDGSTMLVTNQMRILKAAELLIAERWPGLHRAMRWVYDRVGPRLASRIRSPWLADLSYLIFVPIAMLASLAMKLFGRSYTVERAYHG